MARKIQEISEGKLPLKDANPEHEYRAKEMNY